jgi:hypothetical protein
MPAEITLDDQTGFAVDYSRPRAINVNSLAADQPVMPNGEHAWVIMVIHGIDDPEQAMDDMELTAETFVGVTQIHCLLCHVDYKIELRHAKCSQKVGRKSSHLIQSEEGNNLAHDLDDEDGL